ncbi:MAG: N-acetyl-gamma-glutamyl-phosphate reductase [Acidobacteriota bacterium]|nr:N-acetyl-gamma-glutamyl-phosphate reductase [Acidobacteriota bacterium]
MKFRVGVVGVSGYAGRELIKILLSHPAVELAAAMDAKEVGEKPLADIHPALRGRCDLVTFAPEVERLQDCGLDTVFLCTPDKVSYDLVPKMLALGARVIDFSGAYRMKTADSYPKYYGFRHEQADLLAEAVYGLPEWNAPAIESARLIANPGCYPTSVTLSLTPLIRAGMLEAGSHIICDSKSGATGAGRGAKAELMFPEVAENFRPYNPIGHRHAPEMCQIVGWDLNQFSFVPHLLPMNQGILSSIYVNFRQPVRSDQIEAEYAKRYTGRAFVRILGDSRLPETRAVAHTNFCDIAWRLTDGGRRGVLFSAIDNLIKGASGQAVQNFNLMHGLDERSGML